MEPAQVMKELGLTEHKLRFTSSVTMETTGPHHAFVEECSVSLKGISLACQGLLSFIGGPGENRNWRQPKFTTLATFHSVCNAKLQLLIEILLNLRLLPNYSVQQMAEGCLSVDSVLIKVSLGFVGVNSPR